MLKTCLTCCESKEDHEFDKGRNQCKSCLREKRKERENTKRYKEKRKEYKKIYKESGQHAEYFKKYWRSDKYKKSRIEYSKTDTYKKFKKIYATSVRGRFSRTKANAKHNGRKFELSFEEFETLVENCFDSCFYCGHQNSHIRKILYSIESYTGSNEGVIKIQQSIPKSFLRAQNLSVDRVDSICGWYFIGNCVMACPICNMAKGWAIHGDQYKLIAPAVIANIVRICKEAGLEI